MRSVLLALGIVAVFASGAMALAFPTLTGQPAPYVSLTQSPTQITLGSPYPYDMSTNPPGGVYFAVGVGNSPIGDNYVLSTTLHFDLSSGHATELGLLARSNLASQTGYSTSVNPTNGGYLALDKLGGSGAGALATPLPIPNYDSNKDYELVFTVNGSSLTSTVYDGTTPVLTLSGSDSSLTTGQIGVIDLPPLAAGYLSGTFLNSSVGSVPEPGTIAMLAAGALALLGWVGLRRCH
jgi:hypothetical protein